MTELHERLAELEIRQAFQDDVIQTLSDELARQQRQIELLTQKIELLGQRLKEQNHEFREVPNDPPPHY